MEKEKIVTGLIFFFFATAIFYMNWWIISVNERSFSEVTMELQSLKLEYEQVVEQFKQQTTEITKLSELSQTAYKEQLHFQTELKEQLEATEITELDNAFIPVEKLDLNIEFTVKEKPQIEDDGGHYLAIVAPSYGKVGKIWQEMFCRYMTSFLEEKVGEGRFEIVFAEQIDKLPFNRGYALNVGFIYASERADTIVFHDLDLYPFSTTNYGYTDVVQQMANNLCNRNTFRGCDYFPKAFGGSLKMSRDRVLEINGYSNGFWGWGREDDEVSCRIKLHNITVENDRSGYYWHIEGIKPSADFKENHPDFNHNAQLHSKSCTNLKWQLQDGVNVVQAHYARNQSDITLFTPSPDVGYCRFIKFSQNDCRKSNTCEINFISP